ncbi:MAG: hypothetical protein ACI8ZN_001076 [Bacteroidia bacterium]|jgi:hypothetical protein
MKKVFFTAFCIGVVLFGFSIPTSAANEEKEVVAKASAKDTTSVKANAKDSTLFNKAVGIAVDDTLVYDDFDELPEITNPGDKDHKDLGSITLGPDDIKKLPTYQTDYKNEVPIEEEHLDNQYGALTFSALDVTIFPNPTTTSSTIYLQISGNPISIQVIALNGSTTSDKLHKMVDNRYQIDPLTSGLYKVIIQSESDFVVKNLLIQ